MNLSLHFTLAELCATQQNIANEPSDEACMENLKKLAVEILEPIRRYLGGPLRVTSGFRSPRLNEMLRRKGFTAAKNSQHLVGEAADFVTYQKPLARLFWELASQKAAALRFGQLILYFQEREPVFIHVSLPTAEISEQVLLCVHGRFTRLQ
jgi:truncated hemoglobin YjbI